MIRIFGEQALERVLWAGACFLQVKRMKIDRLLGILSVLLQKETAAAPELAEQFEVSRRTINRDIEALCKAGIPVVTRQGAGGGISIMDNYKISRTLLTSTEMRDILAGLRGAFRMFKLNRMDRLCLSGRMFPVRAVLLPETDRNNMFPGAVKARILFDAACKWRLVEERYEGKG